MIGTSPQSNTDKISTNSTWLLRPKLMIALYVGLVLAPVLLAYAQGLPPREWLDELSSGLALSAFAGLLIEFLLSGRFRLVSSHIGIDTTMRFHQLMARSFTVFIILHPFLYVTPMMNTPLPWDTTHRLTLGLTMGSFATGFIAWLALMLIVFFAIFREQRGISYEVWRLSHGIGAVMIAVFGAHHTIEAGRYSGDSALLVFWVVLLAIAIFTLVWVYAIKPCWQLQNPYSVRSVRQVALKTWEIVVAPREGDVIDFSAG